MELKYLLCFLILFSATSVCGQDKIPADGCSYGIGKKTEQFVPGVSDLPVAFDYPQIQQSVYWKRHKMFKALGWGTLATGFVTANAGFWWSVSMYEGNYPEKRKKTAGGICYSGLFLIGASIPCFILSHVCKENAILSVEGGSVTDPLPGGGVCHQPAVALQISF